MKSTRLVICSVIACLLAVAGCATLPQDERRREDDDSIFVMTPNMGGRLCDADQFKLVDRFDPRSRARTAPTCVLGEFKPVTEAQVEETEHRLEVGP